MIGNFNPFVVTAAIVAGVTTNVINVRSTTAATEIQNDVEWLYWN